MPASLNDDLVKIERALLVQISAKKYYSTISFLDEQQEEHLRSIDNTIEQLYEQRAQLWSADRGSEDESALDLEELWRNSTALERQSIQEEFIRESHQDVKVEKSYLDLHMPVKSSGRMRKVIMIITVILLLIVGVSLILFQTLKKRPNDTNSPSIANSGAALGSIPTSTSSQVITGDISTTTSSSEAPVSTTIVNTEPTIDMPMKAETQDAGTPPPQAPPPPLPPSPPAPDPVPQPPAQPFDRNLLQNGDFSKHACPGTKATCYSTDSSTIAPWRVTSDEKQYEINPPGHFTFNPSSYSMDLNSGPGSTAYTISQRVPTFESYKYKLSFSLNENPCRATTKTGFVVASGNPRVEFTASKTTRLYEYVFTGSSGRTTDISIGSTTIRSCGPVIFAVQVFRIP